MPPPYSTPNGVPAILVAHVPNPFESYLTINTSIEPLLGNVPNVVPSAL